MESIRATSPLMHGSDTVDLGRAVASIRAAEARGVDQVWLAQTADGFDATTIAAATTKISIGTSVVPVRGRHPVVMAQQAATLHNLSGGRFVLGIGAGHSFLNEFALGLPPMRPLPAVAEYITIIRSLLRDGRVEFVGKCFTARASYAGPEIEELPIYVGGVRPAMIRLAVRHADGLLLWMCPPNYIAEHVMPVVRATCAEEGKDPEAFPVLAGVLSQVTEHPEPCYARVRQLFAQYTMLPAYRHVLELSGFGEKLRRWEVDDELVDGLAIIADAPAVRARLAEFHALGAVPIPSSIVDTPELVNALLDVAANA